MFFLMKRDGPTGNTVTGGPSDSAYFAGVIGGTL